MLEIYISIKIIMTSQMIGSRGCEIDKIVTVILESPTIETLLENLYFLMNKLGTPTLLRHEVLEGSKIYKTMEIAKALEKILADWLSRNPRDATIKALQLILQKCNLKDIACDLEKKCGQPTPSPGDETSASNSIPVESIASLNHYATVNIDKNDNLLHNDQIAHDAGKTNRIFNENDTLLGTCPSTNHGNQDARMECIIENKASDDRRKYNWEFYYKGMLISLVLCSLLAIPIFLLVSDVAPGNNNSVITNTTWNSDTESNQSSNILDPKVQNAPPTEILKHTNIESNHSLGLNVSSLSEYEKTVTSAENYSFINLHIIFDKPESWESTKSLLYASKVTELTIEGKLNCLGWFYHLKQMKNLTNFKILNKSDLHCSKSNTPPAIDTLPALQSLTNFYFDCKEDCKKLLDFIASFFQMPNLKVVRFIGEIVDEYLYPLSEILRKSQRTIETIYISGTTINNVINFDLNHMYNVQTIILNIRTNKKFTQFVHLIDNNFCKTFKNLNRIEVHNAYLDYDQLFDLYQCKYLREIIVNLQINTNNVTGYEIIYHEPLPSYLEKLKFTIISNECLKPSLPSILRDSKTSQLHRIKTLELCTNCFNGSQNGSDCEIRN